uniref:Uncharacterized protein n=1 Tax=Arundo donax TaxID=35708 RepID=A0A0A9FB77_ARUDO
MWCNRIRVQGF